VSCLFAELGYSQVWQRLTAGLEGLPAPRQPRVVKRAMSRYNAKGKVDRTTYKATIDVTIHAAPLTPDPGPY